ncbi:MAG: NUDIX domain-containing protein [Candidatus Paceibacterota bacterium]
MNTPTEAAIREAKEEVGVDIETDDIKLVHTSYRITPTIMNMITLIFSLKTTNGQTNP